MTEFGVEGSGKPFMQEIDKELIEERGVTSRYLVGVLFKPEVIKACKQLIPHIGPLWALVRETGLAERVSDEQAREGGLAEKNFIIYGNVANSKSLEVTAVVTGGLKRAGIGEGVELLPTDIETAFTLFEFHSEPGFSARELVIPSAYSHGEPGDLWVVSLMRGLYDDEGLTMRPIMVLVRPAAGKALLIQEKKQRREIDISALEKFEATEFGNQKEVLGAIRKLGYNAALTPFPFKDRKITEKLLRPFEFRVAIKRNQ